MADIDAASEGTLERRETPEDQRRADEAEVKLWLDALALAEKEEQDWRNDAEKVVMRYRGEKEYSTKRYRVLYANVQTQAPALYNSVGIPDIRRRFGDRDDDAKMIAQALERTVSCQAEKSDLDSVMEEMTLHRLLPGRAVARIRHMRDVTADGHVNEAISFEPVAWMDFRRGPAKRWEDVPWIAFRLFLTREQLEDLVGEAMAGDSADDGENGEEGDNKPSPAAIAFAGRIPLNASVSGVKKEGQSDQPPTVFKRAEVWQFWDKETKNLVYICPDFKEAPVAKLPDTMQLEGFYPCPRPMMALRTPDSLVPITDYSQYATLAEELETITERLASLVASAKAVGLTTKELAPAFAGLENMEDGQLAASEEAFTLAQNGKIDDAIWFWPLETIVKAISELYMAREETKRTLYEVTGLSDIIRGSTKATETATAQREKAQWASARLQRAQADVARFNRDLFRLAVEVIATKFEPQSIMLASGVQLTEQQVALMRRDVMREYRIDVETDSTIRADLTRQQENMGQFVQGLASLVTALGPVVEAGLMPGETAAALLTGFARSFKLGKQAEDALDKLGDQASQPQQPKPPSPEQMAAQQQAQKDQADIALRQQDQQFKQQSEAQKLAFEAKKHDDTMALEQQKVQMEDARQREQMHREHEIKREGMMMDDMHKREEIGRKSRADQMQADHNSKIDDMADDAHGRTAKQADALVRTLAPALTKLGEGLVQLGGDMRAGMEQQAQATQALADAASAETELVRDPQTGKALGARKRMPQQQVM